MPLVRCPIHNLTYNTDNPRGCPACALEKRGRQSEANVMQELARASQRREQPAEPAPPSEPSWLDRWRHAVPTVDQRRVVRVGGAVIVLLIVTLFWLSRPSFLAQPDPAPVDLSAALPLAVTPGQPMDVVFSILGTRTPSATPGNSLVQRYSYGTGLSVSAINGYVYQLTIAVPSRTWRGIQVGASEQEAEGALALLATPESSGANTASPTRRGRYQVFSSLDARPSRSITARVRPPNGCYDATVTIQPRALGILRDGDQRLAVVGRVAQPLDWVVTRISVVDRSRNGPTEARAC